jgi:hypothetical protein
MKSAATIGLISIAVGVSAVTAGAALLPAAPVLGTVGILLLLLLAPESFLQKVADVDLALDRLLSRLLRLLLGRLPLAWLLEEG